MGLGSRDVNVGAAEPQVEGLCVVPRTPKLEAPCTPLSQDLEGDQLERIWETQWQGEPTNVRRRWAQESPKGCQRAVPEGKGGTVPQLLRNLKELGQKLRSLGRRKGDSDDELDVQGRLDSTMEFRVPRYPSWVEWD